MLTSLNPNASRLFLNLAKTRIEGTTAKKTHELKKNASNQRGQASALHYIATYCNHFLLQLLYDGLLPGRIAGYAKRKNVMNTSHIPMRSLCHADHT